MIKRQNLSVRACSFSLKVWRSQIEEKVFALDSEISIIHEHTQYTFSDAIDLFKCFIEAHSETDDKEDTQQLFRCTFDPKNQGETEQFRYFVFSVHAGYYGYMSRLVDRKTKTTVHTKTRDQADVKEFYVTVIVPKSEIMGTSKRGLMFFQEIGIYGIKTITCNTLQSFCSKAYGITFKPQNLAPDFYLKKILEQGTIQKIIIGRKSKDLADSLYTSGYEKDERTLTPIKITREMQRQLKYVSEAKYNYFLFDGIAYPETKITVKNGENTRTINLHGLDDLSIEEVLPQELLLADGTVDFLGSWITFLRLRMII